MKKIILALLIAFYTLPAPFLYAQITAAPLDYSGFVKCDGVLSKDASGNLKPEEAKRNRICDFAALIDTFVQIINWMFLITVPLATVIFAYGGFLYMTGKEKNITDAKRIFKSVGIGFIIMLVAWIGVRTVVDRFVAEDSGATLFVR